MSVRIRLAERRDAAGIRTIYNHYVAESTALFDMVPRTLDEQVQWIDEHSGAHPAVVASSDGEDAADHVVGFGSLSPFRPRPAYSTTVENSVYLLAEYQGRGIGRHGPGRVAPSRRVARLPLGDRAHRRRQRRVDRAARGVRVRARGHRTRGRPEVRPMARRGGDAAPALGRRRGQFGSLAALPLLGDPRSVRDARGATPGGPVLDDCELRRREAAARGRRSRGRPYRVARGHVHRFRSGGTGSGIARGRTPCEPGARRRGTPRARPGMPVSGTRVRRSWDPGVLR